MVLDVGLPEMDGWTVLERIRELSEVPVLMLTAHGQEADKVRGLRAGADDYLTKPFGNAEFVARVQALLRRSAGAEQGGGRGLRRRQRPGELRRARGGSWTACPVELTATEYRLLAALVRHRGQVLSPVKLLELVWSDPFGIGPDRVKYSVMRLRRKLGADRRRGLADRGGPRLRLPLPRGPARDSAAPQPSSTGEATAGRHAGRAD